MKSRQSSSSLGKSKSSQSRINSAKSSDRKNSEREAEVSRTNSAEKISADDTTSNLIPVERKAIIGLQYLIYCYNISPHLYIHISFHLLDSNLFHLLLSIHYPNHTFILSLSLLSIPLLYYFHPSFLRFPFSSPPLCLILYPNLLLSQITPDITTLSLLTLPLLTTPHSPPLSQGIDMASGYPSLESLCDVRQLQHMFVTYCLLADIVGPSSSEHSTNTLMAYNCILRIWKV